MRHFTSPSGRRWSASLSAKQRSFVAAGFLSSRPANVLRFTAADGMIFDLEDWPSGWNEMSQDSLVALLRIAIATTHLPVQVTIEPDGALPALRFSGPSKPLRVMDDLSIR